MRAATKFAKSTATPFLLIIALAGCSSTPLTPNQLAEAVAYDAAAYNEASAKATNAVMLLNILRSRDRWPWSFSTVENVSSSRSNQVQLSAGWSLPWDGLWKGSSATPNLTNIIKSAPTTSIQNQNDKDFALSILSPVPYSVFEYYWNSGWPKEVLLYLFVQRITETDRENSGDDPVAYDNIGKYIAQCTVENISHERCEFIGKVRTLLSTGKPEIEKPTESTDCRPISEDLSGASAGELEQYYNLGRLFSDRGQSVRIEAGKLCVVESGTQTATFTSSETKEAKKSYQLELRSWQDMIYYLGAFAREASPAKFVEAPRNQLHKDTEANCSNKEEYCEYLFRVTKTRECGSNYAAKASYHGDTYYAGPAVHGVYEKGKERTNGSKNGGNTCGRGQGGGDRSGTVLTLLKEIRMLNQSTEGLNTVQPVTVVGGTATGN